MNLKNKKILITGATGGIGNSVVKKFDELGANIFATGNISKNSQSLQIQDKKSNALTFVNSKKSFGGTCFGNVRKMISKYKKKLK